MIFDVFAGWQRKCSRFRMVKQALYVGGMLVFILVALVVLGAYALI